jgi:DNA polymerase-3 subunit gamma/tau
MASQVFYRKWRPQTLSEVVGQEPVTQTLANALATGRVAHAYLFCGPRGTGKTSTGRILAKALNCLTNGRGEPCNSCDMCQAFNEGRALDLVEIDGASNRGIDEIRALREKINFAPNVARYKVYIIDEVHMLTEPAFNALLKTLEEPPPHAIFILATTEVHKVPLTILSRCQRFDFRRLSQIDIVKKLGDICSHENITVEPQALALIAKAATGSLRDAENLLEQLVLYHGSNISLEKVRAELGISGDQRIYQLAEHILKKEVASSIAILNDVSADGIDLRQFSRSLVEYLRALLLLKSGAETAAGLTPETIEEMKRLLKNISLGELSRIIKLFAQVDFRADPQSTLPIELAIIDSSLLSPEKSKKFVNEHKIEAEPVISSVEPKTEVAKEQRIAAPPVVLEPSVSKVSEVSTKSPPQNIEQIRQRWNDFVNACRGAGSSGNLDALLRKACEAVALEGNILTLGFYWKFQMDKVEDPKYRHLVEDKLREVFGVPYHVRCILTPKDKDAKPQQHPRNPVVNAALEMGARIIGEEHEHDE